MIFSSSVLYSLECPCRLTSDSSRTIVKRRPEGCGASFGVRVTQATRSPCTLVDNADGRLVVGSGTPKDAAGRRTALRFSLVIYCGFICRNRTNYSAVSRIYGVLTHNATKWYPNNICIHFTFYYFIIILSMFIDLCEAYTGLRPALFSHVCSC